MIKNIFVVGCPSIDALKQEDDETSYNIKRKFNIDVSRPILIAKAPVTSELDEGENQFIETIEALKNIKMQKLFVFPNNSARSNKIINLIKKYKFNYCKTLTLKEQTLLKNSKALVGNSSSGIHEAAIKSQ